MFPKHSRIAAANLADVQQRRELVELRGVEPLASRVRF